MLVFGRDGVEQTLPSPTPVATASLLFLPHKDSLLRVTSVRPSSMLLVIRVSSSACKWTSGALSASQSKLWTAKQTREPVQDGDVQLWSLTLAAMVDSLPCGDSVLCATTIDRPAPQPHSGHEQGMAVMCYAAAKAWLQQHKLKRTVCQAGS